MTRADELERLAARVELERRKAAAGSKPRPAHRPVGRPARPRGPDDHGTEQDYRAEVYRARKYGEPPPCDLCKTAHALWERRRKAARIRGAA